MKRSIAILAAAMTTTIAAAPAHATFFHTHYCNCGHSSGAAMCGSTSSTSSSTSSTSGGSTTSSTTSSTSGGSTTSSSTSGGSTTSSTTSGGSTTSSTTSGGSTTSSSTGGTDVPEPGMLGLMGAGLAGLAFVRRRRR
ncbi:MULTISPECIES: PEP-CTERM sorting domain-containing protein [unclassified Novosphingobium]|uniref:PEP-CTERM sorting domain-containing protein n=1 Tax=Novosphingobium TaxID=165696 RepID=UPI00146D2249|nr:MULTISPECIES: PEP-CTERM sorting domain-containing protein [unclassified Novosphingobium]NMN03925.1 cobalamin biosynthesis Mg chelatase CobN [Novosphingobium sp. SG919]NMN86085.1 cobalamin biosynthesis Mg chelatase CobN [Novosphingobium sp. SG916]